jgi:hypothetical protein
MRVLGPKRKFIHLTRNEGDVDVYGQEVTWTEGGSFYGVISPVPKQPDGQNMFNGKIGVQVHYKMRTGYAGLSESDRIKLDGTSRVFDIQKVDDLFEKGKYMVVELHERKE